ncbi:MAG: hypothetical protein H6Q52_3700 [Deltaproteobacteria bacterium]|nr:hypothetical protein [Deltaproteobacteria bacterium]
MGKSMYNFGKRDKEKARQQKQIDKASKRKMAKQQKANMKSHAPVNPADNSEHLAAVKSSLVQNNSSSRLCSCH